MMLKMLPLLLAILWISVGEMSQNSNVLRRITEEMLRSDDALIQAYARKYGEAPQSLNELRLYAIMRGTSYASVDSWGGRLEYLRLGRVNYTLRSFGGDGTQNTEKSEPDPGIFRWGQMVQLGLQYDYDAGGHQARPSVILFAGADDPERKWHAKLFLDSSTGSRRLLVRHKRILKLYMLAPHDGIEEFLWLPGGERIVFTASGSARYSDGVWIWDLKTDHAWNLLELDLKSNGLSPAKMQKGLHLALSSVSGHTPPRVSVFIAPGTHAEMDATWFFHPQNLHVFEVGMGSSVNHILPASDEPANPKTLFDYEWIGASTVATGGHGAGLQKTWLRLPRSGNWESAMNIWQDYAAQNAQSPLAAYAVWSLSLFYRDAAIEAKDRPKEAEILQGYSVELSEGVRRMLAAPGWMRSIRH